MKRRSFKSVLGPLGQVLRNLILITLGSVLCAISVNGILIPKQFFGAGFTGVALVIHYLFPVLPVAALYFLLNIPVYALGWMYVGRRFFLYSIPGAIIFTAALEWVHVPLPIEDKILSALFAGIIVGMGSGIILKSLGSAGGLDILSVIFLKRFSVRLGTTILGFNSLVLVVGAILFSLEGALYTLVYLFVNSYTVNVVMSGLSQRKAVFIISTQWETVSREIMEHINRGVTLLHGHGGYTGREIQIIYTVITFRELARLKELVHRMDPDVFLVVTDTTEVMGYRIGNQPHW